MATGNGITTSTAANLVIGSGIVVRNGQIFGASMDDNVFRVEREIINAELNGLKGALFGTHYVRRSEGILETSIPEVSGAVLVAGLPGFELTEYASADVIDEDATRRLPDSAYADWELDIERINGGAFQFEVDRALNTATFEGRLTDGEFFRPRYELHATWRANHRSPHRIRILDTAS